MIMIETPYCGISEITTAAAAAAIAILLLWLLVTDSVLVASIQ